MKQKKKITFFLITLLVFFLIAAYLAELYLIYKSNNVKFIKDDDWLQYNIKKKEIDDLKPYINSMYTLNHSLKFPKYFSPSTFSNSSIFTCNENGYHPIINSDRYGFYNDNKVWEKPLDIVFVGDSFTAGSCVNIEDNIVYNYKKNFQNKNILNLGTPGSFPLLDLLKLKEYIFHTTQNQKPKKFYWLYYEGNDLRELRNFNIKYKETYLFKYLTNPMFSQDLLYNDKARNTEISKSLDYVLSIVKNKNSQKNSHKYKFHHFLTMAKIRSLLLNSFFSEKQDIDFEVLNLFENIISQANYLVKKNDGELIFVYLPTIERYNKYKVYNFKVNNKSILDIKLRYSEVIKMIKKQDVKIIDIKKDIFDKFEDPLELFPQRKHHHYNSKGYKLIADYLSSKFN